MTGRSLMPGRARYFKKVLSVEPASFIGYWPLWEGSGTKAEDISGKARHGTHVGVTLGQPGIGDGRTSSLYDGSLDYTNIYSPALAAAFNGAEGTLLIWAKVANAGVWTDGTLRVLVDLQGGTDRIYIDRTATNNQLEFKYDAGATETIITDTSLAATTGWFCLALSWSKSGDAVKAYISGAQVGTTQTGLGTWTQVLNTSFCIIGAYNVAPNYVWSGTLAHDALWSKALTATQIAYLSRV